MCPGCSAPRENSHFPSCPAPSLHGFSAPQLPLESGFTIAGTFLSLTLYICSEMKARSRRLMRKGNGFVIALAISTLFSLKCLKMSSCETCSSLFWFSVTTLRNKDRMWK